MTINSERLARDVIVIGASAGGIEALRTVIAGFPKELEAAVAIVLHRSPHYASQMQQVFRSVAKLPVTEAKHGESVQRGRIYLAPADRHLCIEGEQLWLRRTPKVHFTRPAVDPLFESASAMYGRRVVGVLLSGSGDDGTAGLIKIKAGGGISIVQHPVEAAFPSMPTSAILYDKVDIVLPAYRISEALVALSLGGSIESSDPSFPPPLV